MSLEDSAISKAMESVNRSLTPPGSAIEAIIKSQEILANPFRSGVLSTMAKISETLPNGILSNSTIGLAGALNTPKFFNPVPSETLAAISKINEIGKQHQKIAESISLSLAGKETFLNAALQASSLMSAINVGSALSSKVAAIQDKGVFAFLEKMLPPNLPFDDLKLLNTNYKISPNAFINPFIETNQMFKKAIDVTTLGKYQDMDAFYGGVKSLRDELGEELTSVIDETINFDSDSGDYSEMVASLTAKIDALKESVDALQNTSEGEKQVVSSALMLVLNFAKAKGLPLISIALALYLSSGTSSKIENTKQSIESKIQSSSNRIEQTQVDIEVALKEGVKNNSVYYQDLKNEADSLKEQYIEMESKMDSILRIMNKGK